MINAQQEKGGYKRFPGINLVYCENPFPPISEAVAAAKNELKKSNFYTEPRSERLKSLISDSIDVPAGHIHINAGSELIIRQLCSLFSKKTHLLTPTWTLFEKIIPRNTFTYLKEEDDFLMDLSDLKIPKNTTLVPIVNPNNPTGGIFNIKEALELVKDNPKTMFLIDEAFIEFGGKTAVDLPERYDNVIVTRTFSKGFGLAGFRVGYAVLPKRWAQYMDEHNDPVPLARASEAAAIAALRHKRKIMKRVKELKARARKFSDSLNKLQIKTYPSETFFFLGRIPIDKKEFIRRLKNREILLKPAEQKGLEKGNFIKFATSTQENNKVVIKAIKDILKT